MERGEPTLVPEWYRNSTGTGSSGGNSNHHSSSPVHSDEHGARHLSRNRLLVSAGDRDTLHYSSSADRKLSSRRSVSSNGSISHERDSSSNSRPYSSFGRNHHDMDREKDNGFCERGASVISSFGKPSFERDFPSLGAEDRQPEVARVSSPGPGTAIDNLSRITPTAIGGDGWTSALAEVPVRVGGSGPVASSMAQTFPGGVSSANLSSSTGLNMAETLAQAPLRVRTAPQVSVDTKKIEEFNLLQYSKLIPMTPSLPKSLTPNSLEKSKAKGARSGDNIVASKVGQHSVSQFSNHTLRVPARSDMLKAAQVGSLQVLNREKNGVTLAKDSSGLTIASRVVAPLGGVPAAITPPPKSPANLKPKLDNRGVTASSTQSASGEKRPNSQAQNRSDFFNIIRQKTPNRSSDLPELSNVPLSPCSENFSEQTEASAFVSQKKGSPATSSGLECLMEEEIGSTQDIIGISEMFDRSIHDQTFSNSVIVPRSFGVSGDSNLSSGPVVPNYIRVDEFPSSGPVVSESAPLAEESIRLDCDVLPECKLKIENATSFNDASSLDPAAAPSEEEVAFLRQLGWDENAGGDELTPEEIEDFVRQHPKQKASLRLGLAGIVPDSGKGGV